ncbi:MAG TPA: hypothetical protein VN824_04630, partial [Puia sp.]|nr:hypothetical protein [Puia sp.]
MRKPLLVAFLLCVIVSTRSVGQMPIPINGQTIDTCSGTDISLTVNDPNPSTYSWSFSPGGAHSIPCRDGVSFSGSQTSVLTLHTDSLSRVVDEFLFQCVVTHPDGGFTSYQVNINLNNITGVYPIVTQKSSIVCAGANDVIYSVDSRHDVSGFLWSYSGSGASITTLNDTAIKISFGATATSGTLGVTGQNKCGFSSTAQVTITVNSQTSAPAGTISGPPICSIQSVAQAGTTYSDAAACGIIAKIIPTGTHPVSGSIQSCVLVDGNVQSYNNVSYVQRHFNLMPATDALTSTATTTLYFTQGDFDAYNASKSGISLPSGPSDSAGIASLRISQFNGTGTSPGTYPSQRAVIDPDDNNIIWNAASARWEVSFSHTGFGGFFISGNSLLLGPPRFTDQPKDVIVCAGSSSYASTGAAGNNVTGSVWQLSQD